MLRVHKFVYVNIFIVLSHLSTSGEKGAKRRNKSEIRGPKLQKQLMLAITSKGSQHDLSEIKAK